MNKIKFENQLTTIKKVRYKETIEVQLDLDFFNEEWLEKFRKKMFYVENVHELAEYISTRGRGLGEIDEVIGYPWRDGERPWDVATFEEHRINDHININSSLDVESAAVTHSDDEKEDPITYNRGELILYRNRDRYEIGIIKEKFVNSEGKVKYRVYYDNGDTSQVTDPYDMQKIFNQSFISEMLDCKKQLK